MAIKITRGLTRNIIALGIVSFLTDMSSEMILPLLPLFLTNVLMAPPSIVGLIEGIADSTSSLLKVFSGWYSDKVKKRKPLVLAGYFLSSITKPLLAIASAWYHVVAIRFFDRIGKGIRSAPRDAIIADSVDANNRGRAYGFHRSMDSFGAVIGPVIAYLILISFAQQEGVSLYREIFLISFIPGIIAVIALWLYVREVPVSQGEKEPEIRLGFNMFDKKFRAFILIVALFGLANFSYAFYILKAQQIGLETASIMLLYIFFNIIYSISAMPAGILSDKIGRRNTLLIGFALFTAMCIWFAFASTLMEIIALFAIYGVFNGIIETVQRAFASDLVTKELRGTALGTFHTVVGIVALPASFIAGLLWQFYGAGAAFLYGAVLGGVATILLVLLVRF